MSFFLDLVSLIGSAASITGVSLKDFLSAPPQAPQDQTEIRNFVHFLEGRRVLVVGIDEEEQTAVIRSLEEIKREIEALRVRCSDEQVKSILLALLFKVSAELQKLHRNDSSTAKGKYAMYVALQGVRFEIAKVLAVFCAAFKIDVVHSPLHHFILNFAVRPRR